MADVHPPKTYPQALAEVVASAIAEKGLTLRGLVDATGIPLTTLHRRLRHPDKSPLNAAELVAIAQTVASSPSALSRRAERDMNARAA